MKTALKILRLAVKLGYTVTREDLTGLIGALRKLSKNYRAKPIILNYARFVKWFDWQVMKHRALLAIVDPRGTSSECL